jgi:hypothetical protein
LPCVLKLAFFLWGERFETCWLAAFVVCACFWESIRRVWERGVAARNSTYSPLGRRKNRLGVDGLRVVVSWWKWSDKLHSLSPDRPVRVTNDCSVRNGVTSALSSWPGRCRRNFSSRAVCQHASKHVTTKTQRQHECAVVPVYLWLPVRASRTTYVLDLLLRRHDGCVSSPKEGKKYYSIFCLYLVNSVQPLIN